MVNHEDHTRSHLCILHVITIHLNQYSQETFPRSEASHTPTSLSLILSACTFKHTQISETNKPSFGFHVVVQLVVQRYDDDVQLHCNFPRLQVGENYPSRTSGSAHQHHKTCVLRGRRKIFKVFRMQFLSLFIQCSLSSAIENGKTIILQQQQGNCERAILQKRRACERDENKWKGLIRKKLSCCSSQIRKSQREREREIVGWKQIGNVKFFSTTRTKKKKYIARVTSTSNIKNSRFNHSVQFEA